MEIGKRIGYGYQHHVHYLQIENKYHVHNNDYNNKINTSLICSIDLRLMTSRRVD